MSLEWFSRMENAVRMSITDLWDGTDEYEIYFDTDTTEEHPAFIFSVADEFDIDEFCLISFDPVNQEFYSYHFDIEAELHAKVLFANLDQMLSFIQASYYEYLDEVDDELLGYDDFEEEDDIEFEDDDEIEFEDESLTIYNDKDIEWLSNDKYLTIENNGPATKANYEIHYKLGRDKDTGDGILLRNTVSRQKGGETEEKVMFYFSEEEGPFIVDLVNEFLDQGRGSL